MIIFEGLFFFWLIMFALVRKWPAMTPYLVTIAFFYVQLGQVYFVFVRKPPKKTEGKHAIINQ